MTTFKEAIIGGRNRQAPKLQFEFQAYRSDEHGAVAAQPEITYEVLSDSSAARTKAGRLPFREVGRMKIIENSLLTIAGPEDWSRVRSPARARRRRKYGHHQNIVATRLPDPNFYVTGDVIYCHPETAKKFRTAMEDKADQINRDIEFRTLNALLGGWPNAAGHRFERLDG